MSNQSSLMVRLAPFLIIFTKFLKLAKFFKLAKPMIMVATMSFSAIAYSFLLGPWFAVGLVGMLFVHEMGHVAAMNMRGYKTSAPVFIPFLGAVIFAPRMDNRDDEAFIGIGGPVLGGLAAAIALFFWYLMPNKESDIAIIVLMISYIGMFINVFNMLPIRPLDGGRVTQAVGTWFKYIGVTALAGLSLVFREPVILFIWILILPEITILPLRLRAVLASLLWVAMVLLMATGFSEQPLWVDIVDCVFGFIIVLSICFQAYQDIDMSNEDDNRPQLTPREKWKWFIYYGVLTTILVGLMFFQVQNLPTIG